MDADQMADRSTGKEKVQMKKNEQLFDIMGDIPEKYVEDAMNDNAVPEKRINVKRVAGTIAACAAAFAAVAAVPVLMMYVNGKAGNGNDQLPAASETVAETSENEVSENQNENTDPDTDKEKAEDSDLFDDTKDNSPTYFYELNKETNEYEVVFELTDTSSLSYTVIPWSVETAVLEISDYFKDEYGLGTRDINKLFNSGYRIYLTTDRDIQDHLDEKYSDWYYFPESLSDQDEMIQSAIAVLDYNGHILGVEGKLGKNEPDDNFGFNIAYEGGRAVGSAITPLTAYGYALENGMLTPETEFCDEYLPEYTVPDVEFFPRNFDGAPSGGIYPALYFFKQSIRTLPTQIVYNNGNNLSKEVFDFATQKLHLDLDPEWDADYPALCLGETFLGPSVINLANAYMPYGNGGRYCKASIISRCVDSTGKVIIDNENREYEQAVSKETADTMNMMLREVITNGTGTAAALENCPVAGKPGCTDNWRDLTFVGLTPDYVSAMWVGYDCGTNPWAIEGANSAGIWKSVFGEYAEEHYSGADFP